MDRAAKQPCGPQRLVERNHRGASSGHVKQIEQGFHEVVGLDGTAGDADDGDFGFGSPLPAEIVGQTHAAGGIALHRMDSTIGGAGAHGDYGPGMRREPVDPLAGGDGLTGCRVGAERGPIAFALIVFVGNGAFDDENERLTPPCAAR